MKLAVIVGKSIVLICIGSFIFWFMPDLLQTPESNTLPEEVSPSDVLFLRVWFVLFIAALIFVLIVEEQSHNQSTSEAKSTRNKTDALVSRIHDENHRLTERSNG
jgi:hypothetical protein